MNEQVDTYVDGFLIPVAEAKKDEYLRMAKIAADIFIEWGALEVTETWGDDLIRGEKTDFYRAVQAKDGESVVLSWIVWPSKAMRDEGNAKAHTEPRFAEFSSSDIFSGRRMIYSGFQTILSKHA